MPEHRLPQMEQTIKKKMLSASADGRPSAIRAVFDLSAYSTSRRHAEREQITARGSSAHQDAALCL